MTFVTRQNAAVSSTSSSLLAARLGRRVRVLRSRVRLTVRELAAVSGLSARLLALIEAGQANPTLSTLDELAQALGVDVVHLLDADEDDELPGRRSVALLGLRGAGKSTVGQQLARVLEWPFVEVDRLIERESGLSLTALFELHGEHHVRVLEARVLAGLVADAPAVIACGGGIVTSTEAWAMLRASTLTVWLKATPQRHWDRVRAQGDERPMARRSAARAELDALWAARAPLYAQAAVHIDTNDVSVDDVVARIAQVVTGTRTSLVGAA